MTAAVAGPPVNVLDPAFYIDPWEAYRWLRDEAPVFWDPIQQIWAVSRYDDIMAIEKDGARYSSFAGSRPHIDQRADQSMINLDDPAHKDQRGLVSRRFTPPSRSPIGRPDNLPSKSRIANSAAATQTHKARPWYL